jgi:hypothetical protein
MRLAYIISAYKRPEQLGRLVHRLAAPGTSFAIHVDAKTSDAVYAEMVDRTRGVPDVRFVSRHVCRWGGFGHVRASLKGIAQLVEREVEFDYAILLTGQDYPLMPTVALTRFFERSEGRSFMSHWPLPFAPWTGRGGLDRIERWHAVGPARLHVRLPFRRRLPDGLRPYGGSPYWSLARPLVEYVHSLVEARPVLARFFEHSYIPDELFFQTLLANSSHATSITGDNLRYIDWSTRPGPKILTVDDLPGLLDSDKLFARKFDTTIDSAVLDELDAHLGDRLPVSAR